MNPLHKKISDLFEVKEKTPEVLFREMGRLGKLDNRKVLDILQVIINELDEIHKKID